MSKTEFAKAAKSQTSSNMTIDARSEITEVHISGEIAFMWSHLSVTITPGQGVPIERSGHTLTIFKKHNDSWLLARDANMLLPVKQ